MTEDRLAELMVRVTDDIATAAERDELMRHLAAHPELRRELDAHLAIKAATDGLVQRLQLDQIEDAQRAQPLQRWVITTGLALFAVGAAVLTGGGLAEALLDDQAPMWVRIGVATLSGGLFLLFSAVVLGRLRAAPHDKYTEVIR